MGNCFRKAHVKGHDEGSSPSRTSRGQPSMEGSRRTPSQIPDTPFAQTQRAQTAGLPASRLRSASPKTPRNPIRIVQANSAPAAVAQDLPDQDRGVLRDVFLSVPHLPTRRDGRPIINDPKPMNEQTLRLALQCMSDFIEERGRLFTVITIGGAIDTLLLKARRTTNDVEVFGSNLEPEDLILLRHASYAAVQQLQAADPPLELSDEWFNNYTLGSLDPDPGLLHRITNEALAQKEVVFEGKGKGLKLIAAPWSFSLYNAIDRYVKRGPQDPKQKSDLAIATKYMRQYLARHRYAPIQSNMMRAWAMFYRGGGNVDAQGAVAREAEIDVFMQRGVRAVQREYMLIYGQPGIVGFDPAESEASSI